MMRYRGRMRKVAARGGTVVMRLGRKWRRVKPKRRTRRKTRRTRKIKRRIAMRVRVKRRWKSLYKYGSGFRIR